MRIITRIIKWLGTSTIPNKQYYSTGIDTWLTTEYLNIIEFWI